MSQNYNNSTETNTARASEDATGAAAGFTQSQAAVLLDQAVTGEQHSGLNHDIIQTTTDANGDFTNQGGSIISDSSQNQTLPGPVKEPIIKKLSLQDAIPMEQSAREKSETTPIQESSCPGNKDDDASPTETETNNLQQASTQSAYRIKKIKFQGSTALIVTQNENGPCPLIAIVNVLLLNGKIKLPVSVQILERVTPEELLNYLGDCILESTPKNITEADRHNYERNREDAMAVLHKLQTGLDVNIRFDGVMSFEYTSECIVFDLLGINLYHGWLVDPDDLAKVVTIGNCSYNQLVENIIIHKQSDREETVREALVAEQFLSETASQLTCYGLRELASIVKPGELCVFFRNNHFSTLYKQDGKLFVLITDQGFLTESEVVWQTLSNVRNDEQFVNSGFDIYNQNDQPGDLIETRSSETKEMRKQDTDDTLVNKFIMEQFVDFLKQQEREEAQSGQKLATGTISDPFTDDSRHVPESATDDSAGGLVDPFTGGERYIPGRDPAKPAGQSNGSDPFTVNINHRPASSQPGPEEKPGNDFPKTSFHIFDQGNISTILGKIKEFNEAADVTVQDSEIEQLEELATGLISSSEEEDQLETLMTLLGWPEDKVFPALDVLRLAVRYQATNSYMFSDEQAQSTLELLLSFLSLDSSPANKRLTLKVLCNAFSCRAGLGIMTKECDRITEKLQHCAGSQNKNIDIALASVLLNYSVLHHLNNDEAAKIRCLSIVSGIVGSVSDSSAVYKYLVCVGTLVAGSDACCKAAKSKGIQQFVKTCVQCTDQQTNSRCAGNLAALLKK